MTTEPRRLPNQLLKDQVAIVTGASQGIGQAIALGLAGEGMGVMVVDKQNEAGCEETVRRIVEGCAAASYLLADVSNAAQVAGLFHEVLKRFGRLDLLVNNAGMQIKESFLDASEENWDRVMAVNLKSVFLCSQQAARMMIERRTRGKIINIASNAAFIYIPGNGPHYHASKAGVLQLTRVMAVELAPFGIHVNAIAPGAVDTAITRDTLADPVKKEQLLRRIPLGTIAQPRDLVGCAIFLASSQSDWMTGEALLIDGGATLW